jgi:hypothetical protein
MSSRGCYGGTKLNSDKQIVNWSFKVAKNNQKSGVNGNKKKLKFR